MDLRIAESPGQIESGNPSAPQRHFRPTNPNRSIDKPAERFPALPAACSSANPRQTTVGDVKTSNSERIMTVDAELLGVLKAWYGETQFSDQDDWVFASPVQIGRLPWSYKQVWLGYRKAAVAIGIDGISTHSMRHTYRAWLDSVGTSIAVQQKLMRHADIRTTMNIYGDVVTNEMAEAGSKVAGLAIGWRIWIATSVSY